MRLSALLLPHGNRFVPTLSACLLCYSSSYSLSAYLTVDDLSVGDLLITEVMANPAAVSDDAGEWFEIINTTTDEIDLNGILLRDNGSDQHTVSSATTLLLAAGAYFTFGRNGDTNNNGGYQTDYTYRAFSLANNSDEIILGTATTIIDSLFYSTSIFGAAGNSAELTVSGFSLTPSDSEVGGHEFDEDDVEYFAGDREVLEVKPDAPVVSDEEESSESSSDEIVSDSSKGTGSVVNTQKAPKPVGAYPHARRVGDLLFLSGVGPRQPVTDAIPGGPIRDADKNPLDYDAAAQTRAVIENIRIILEASGSSLDRVIDVQAFLIDMDRDFKAYNKVYAEYFTDIQATRTTIAIRALPTPIAVEFKVIALPGDVPKPPL